MLEPVHVKENRHDTTKIYPVEQLEWIRLSIVPMPIERTNLSERIIKLFPFII